MKWYLLLCKPDLCYAEAAHINLSPKDMRDKEEVHIQLQSTAYLLYWILIKAMP